MKKSIPNITDSISDMNLKKELFPYLKPMEPIATGIPPAGSLRNALKCILFDVYGTLFISGTGDISIARKTAGVSRELQALLDKFQVPSPPGELLESFFAEIENAHRDAKLKGVDYPEVQIDRIWSRILKNETMAAVRRFSLEFELIVNPVYPMPHLASVLDTIRKAALLSGIISNAQFYTPLLFNWFLDADLSELGMSEDLLFYSYEIGYAKPSPRVFELASKKLNNRGIFPEYVLYIGNDVSKDILPAKRVGFQTALFAGDARSLRLGDDDQPNKRLPADLIITDLRQLLPHINGVAE